MSGPATGSRAYFSGPPWWLLGGIPAGMLLGLWALEAAGVPRAPAVLGLFAVLFAVHIVVATVRGGWSGAGRAMAVSSAAGLLAGAVVMASGLTVTGIGEPWSEETYLPGIAAMAVVLIGVQYLLHRRRVASTATESERARIDGETTTAHQERETR